MGVALKAFSLWDKKSADALRDSTFLESIGVTGFEPATSRPPAVRSSQTEPYPETLISFYHYV